MKFSPGLFHTSKISYCCQLNTSLMHSYNSKLNFCDFTAQNVIEMETPMFAKPCSALVSAFLPPAAASMGSSQRSPEHFQAWLFLGRSSERPDCTVKWDFTTPWPSLLENVSKTLRMHFQRLNREYAWLEKSFHFQNFEKLRLYNPCHAERLTKTSHFKNQNFWLYLNFY